MKKSTYMARTGHIRDKVVHKGNNIQSIRRRQTALANLEAKKESIEAENKESKEPIELDKDHNYNRIKREISVLKSKL